MSDTPETDACWDDKECNILEHARRLERERDEQCRLLGMSAERECDLRGKLERERALADRLAGALEMVRDADDDCHKDGLQTIPSVARHKIDLSLAAWKEARSE